MAVYVDPIFVWPTARLIGQALRVATRNKGQWCHMWCDVGDEAELHRIAKVVGMKRGWFQDKVRFPHYDLVPSRRVKAIKAGAVEMDYRTWKMNQIANL